MPEQQFRKPRLATIEGDGEFSLCCLDDLAQDRELQSRVRTLFTPSPPYRPGDPQLVQELILDFAPWPAQAGVEDWNRPLRADEMAIVWGTPLAGDDVRRLWLYRADELCRAWGIPLAGPGGLVPGHTLQEIIENPGTRFIPG